jgi:hypothetical protein
VLVNVAGRVLGFEVLLLCNSQISDCLGGKSGVECMLHVIGYGLEVEGAGLFPCLLTRWCGRAALLYICSLDCRVCLLDRS